jgi:hypothetical protein
VCRYTRVSSYSEFKQRIEGDNYHDFCSPGDILTYNWIYTNIHIKKHFDFLSNNGMKLIVQGYLIDWGGMGRWLSRENSGSESVDQIADKIVKALNGNKSKVQRLTMLNLLKDLENAEDDIKKVFDSVCSVELKHGLFGVVAAGKLMHMLFPKLCVIWDNKYVLNRRFGEKYFERNGKGYYDYLKIKREELRKITTEKAIKEIEQEHTDFLLRNGYENIRELVTKLLDECNY